MPATAIEQMILELINRARLDPAGEAARDGIDLNEGLPAGTISTASKQPLAMNETLLSVARGHSSDMLARQYFAHNTPDNPPVTPDQRISAAGYSYSWWGENIAWQGTTGTVTNAMSVDLERQLFVDAGVDGRGHRTNLMNANFQEVGAGVENGPFMGYNGTLLTEDFGKSGSQQFLTGVSYTDTDHDNFYSIGEGRNGVTVAVAGGPSGSTAGAGGYALSVAAGVRNVTFSGGGLAAPVSVAVTVTAGTNALVDMVDQGVIYTSASLTDLGGATRIVGLGTFGLTLVGDGGADTFVGTKGNDTIQGGGGIDTVDFSGARSAYTLTDLGGGSVRVAGPDGTDTLSSIERLVFTDQTVTWGTAQPAVPHDFNGDRTSDILWANSASNAVGYWQVSGGHVASFAPIGNAGAYQIAGSGDFDGDGRSDVLLHNNTSADTGYWNTASGTTTWVDLGSGGSPYQIAGVGDFNHDGTSDVLWHNSTSGDTGYWNETSGHAAWVDLGSGGTYQVAGVGDFNGDGTSDVLLHNNTSGDTGYWNTSSGQTAWVDLGSGGSPYQIAGVGDFNGNGTSDVLWHNNTSGDTGYWNTSSGHTAWVDLGSGAPGYQITGIGDYNGDGVSDVLWQNSTSNAVGFWNVASGQPTWNALGTGAPGWQSVNT